LIPTPAGITVSVNKSGGIRPLEVFLISVQVMPIAGHLLPFTAIMGNSEEDLEKKLSVNCW